MHAKLHKDQMVLFEMIIIKAKRDNALDNGHFINFIKRLVVQSESI